MPSDLLIFDEDDLNQANPSWNASEWIGCGRTYLDVPEHVALEAMRARQIPAEISCTLPSELLSPAGFYASSTLPPWNDAYDASKTAVSDVDFDSAEPSFIPKKPVHWALLPIETIQRLETSFGQAWLDGRQSIRDSRDWEDVVYLPLWAVTYARVVRQMCRCWAIWRDAIFLDLLSSIVGWMGRVGCGLQDLAYENLAEVLGENMLVDSVVDALVQDLKHRVRATDSAATYILADTFFATSMSEGAFFSTLTPTLSRFPPLFATSTLGCMRGGH